jgi:hypothetical protein
METAEGISRVAIGARHGNRAQTTEVHDVRITQGRAADRTAHGTARLPPPVATALGAVRAAVSAAARPTGNQGARTGENHPLKVTTPAGGTSQPQAPAGGGRT